MNQTLQDRLVKELRLRDIATMEAGNTYLPEFMEDYNRRFARPPRNPHDAHRPLRGDEDLYRIFTWQEERTLSQNLTVHYKRVTYLIERSTENLALARKRVVVHEWEDGSVELHCQGRKLAYSVFDNDQLVGQGAIVENKRLGAVLSLIQVSQADRDRERLAKKGPTLREKARIVAKRAAAGFSVPTAPPTLVPVPSSDGRLDAMLSYLKAFDEEQRSRRKLQNVKAALRRARRSSSVESPVEATHGEDRPC
jgi:hypothetical protein